jgi:hypothetical protein
LKSAGATDAYYDKFDVRYWHKADIAAVLIDVRFWE